LSTGIAPKASILLVKRLKDLAFPSVSNGQALEVAAQSITDLSAISRLIDFD
jgi:hypothetical protein